jgi:hypothetical protein
MYLVLASRAEGVSRYQAVTQLLFQARLSILGIMGAANALRTM